jgi:hypothetical protein
MEGHDHQIFGQQIEDASLATPNLQASNGILHILDHVLPASFDAYTLADMESQSELVPLSGQKALPDVVDFVQARDDLKELRDKGMTFLACSARAMRNIDTYTESINGAATVLDGEFLNASLKTSTRDLFVEYSILPQNFYYDKLSNNTLALTKPISGMGHMWVTKQGDKLCFNNACVVMEPTPQMYKTSNG